MDVQTEVKWIEKELLDLKDPIFISAVKKMIQSMKSARQNISIVQRDQDIFMAEAEADIKSGNLYSIEEARKVVESWDL